MEGQESYYRNFCVRWESGSSVSITAFQKYRSCKLAQHPMIKAQPYFLKINYVMFEPNSNVFIDRCWVCHQYKKGSSDKFMKVKCSSNNDWNSSAQSSQHFHRLADWDKAWELSLRQQQKYVQATREEKQLDFGFLRNCL